VVASAKTAKDQTQTVEKPARQVPHDRIPEPQGRILRAKDVMRMIGLSRSTIWRLEHEGKFPKRANIGGNAVGWLDTEIRAWIDNRFGEGK
jgi:prophage regulatory protein